MRKIFLKYKLVKLLKLKFTFLDLIENFEQCTQKIKSKPSVISNNFFFLSMYGKSHLLLFGTTSLM